MSDSEGITQESLDERAESLNEKRARIQELKTEIHVSTVQSDLELRDAKLSEEEDRLDREIADLQAQADLKASMPQAANTQDAKDNMARMLEHIAAQKAANAVAGVSATDAEVRKQVANTLGVELVDVKEAAKSAPDADGDGILDPDAPAKAAPAKAAPHKAAAKAADSGKDE